MTASQVDRLRALKLFHAARNAGSRWGREEFLALPSWAQFDVALGFVFSTCLMKRWDNMWWVKR